MLASELPEAQLVNAPSILELRLHPERLTDAIAGFVKDCWGGLGRDATGRAAA